MTEEGAKAVAYSKVVELVQRFQHNEADCLLNGYNETQARTDFITPLLEAFGWDVHNHAGHSLALREVIEEATVEVGEERLSKRPDYELRLARQRKLFVEAKKPSVRIDRDRAPAFQTRRYGYSASLPISVLTNFHQLAIYDCQPVPQETDEAHVARLLLVGYHEFEEQFEMLWLHLSRRSVYSGEFDKHFAVDVTRHGSQQFDDFFLQQVRSWRERLAIDIHNNTPDLNPDELTYAVQLFLSRIVFLRICEDRDIERHETLKGLDTKNTFNAFITELRRADKFYDSGLFRLLDDDRLGIRVSDKVLQGIIAELYYPQSPYTFSVIETEVLGEIYEQFLGEVIKFNGTTIQITNKPEIRESGGVVPTPRYIVDSIVTRTLEPALRGKTPDELADFAVVDPCCGSGIFLLSVFEFILDHHLNWYISNNLDNHAGHTIFEVAQDQWRLTFQEKRRILVQNIRGVDIDHNAVEVARFSLLLKLIENETAVGLRDFVTRHRTPALPSLNDIVRSGNSLVSSAEWAEALGPISATLSEKINPLSWQDEFSAEMMRGGFDVIVANPPYIRIQNMATYSPEEVRYYQCPDSPYEVAHQDNFDKYALFIERTLTLLRQNGRLGVIVPHKFMTTRSGHALRLLISSNQFLENVVHFGIKPVFGRNISNYTCIMVMDKTGNDTVQVEKAGPLEAWRYGETGVIVDIPSGSLGEDNWEFSDEETRNLFKRIHETFSTCLNEVSEIFVGVQTSKDALYIFNAVEEDATTITLNWDGRDWPIERDILRPCLLDVPLVAYARPHPNTWMIFPYHLTAGRAQLVQPEEMNRKFPNCLAYLQARRGDLEERNIVGGVATERQFYQFGRSQSLTKFSTPKIILPILSTAPRYAYDDQNIMATGGGNGPYYMVHAREDNDLTDYYLLAVLNHPLSEAFVRTNTSTFRGGYYSHGKQFIENLPIPIPADDVRNEIEALVRELVDLHGQLVTSRTPHQRIRIKRLISDRHLQIETYVTGLFGLSSVDMDIVRAVPIPD